MEPEQILREIVAHFPTTDGKVVEIRKGHPYLAIECDHSKADQIGQFAIRQFSQSVETYFACHQFRRAHLSIHLK